MVNSTNELVSSGTRSAAVECPAVVSLTRGPHTCRPTCQWPNCRLPNCSESPSVSSTYWASAQHSTAQIPKQSSSFLLDADQPPAPSSPPKLAAAATWMLTPRGWPESVPHLDIAGSPAGPAAAAPGAALCLGSSAVRSSLVADASLHHGRGRDHRRVSSSCRAWPQSHQTTPSAAAKLKLEEALNSTLKKLERSHVLQILKKHCVL